MWNENTNRHNTRHGTKRNTSWQKTWKLLNRFPCISVHDLHKCRTHRECKQTALIHLTHMNRMIRLRGEQERTRQQCNNVSVVKPCLCEIPWARPSSYLCVLEPVDCWLHTVWDICTNRNLWGGHYRRQLFAKEIMSNWLCAILVFTN